MQELIITGKKRNGENFEEHKRFRLLSKVPFKNTKMPTADSYAFEYIFDPQEIKSFQFYVKVNDVLILAKALNNRFCGFVKLKKNSIPLKNYRLTYHHFHHVFKVSQRHVVTDYLYELKSLLFYPKKQLPGILYYRYLGLHSKKVWLYSDSLLLIMHITSLFMILIKMMVLKRYYVVYGDTSF